MSTTIRPTGSAIGSPAPIAAASDSSIRCTSRAPADSDASLTARRSTSVTPEGAHITSRGREKRLDSTFSMNRRSIASVTSKSAIPRGGAAGRPRCSPACGRSSAAPRCRPRGPRRCARRSPRPTAPTARSRARARRRPCSRYRDRSPCRRRDAERRRPRAAGCASPRRHPLTLAHSRPEHRQAGCSSRHEECRRVRDAPTGR